MRSLLFRVGLALAIVALVGATPASAKDVPKGPTLEVANPSPGAMLETGAMTIEGVAYDPVATEGIGVDRVSVFLDDRDAGGMFLGDAKLGQPTFMPTEGVQLPNAGWMLLTPALKGTGDGHMLYVYAHSGVTGDETVLRIPVTIGEKAGTSAGYETPGGPPADFAEPTAPSYGE